ncbi:hypothetical protein TNCV_2425301 [Trichonephila clavipes]|nr:hypothetical protein TNCV_2425301 [Trichonephila clavipes]
MRTRGDRDVYPKHPIPSCLVVGQCDDNECLLPMFVVDPTNEDAPAGDAASRVAAALVSELRVHAATNVVELYVQTLFVLRTTPLLDSGLLTGMHDHLRLCS